MERESREVTEDSEFSVTLYGCSSIAREDRQKLATVFCEVLEAVLGSREEVVRLQSSYNQLINRFAEMSLPITVLGEEAAIVDRWTSAYQAAFDSAFVAVFGNLHSIPEEAHFEVDD